LQTASVNDFQQSTLALVISLAVILLCLSFICVFRRRLTSRSISDSINSDVDAGEVGITYTHVDSAGADSRSSCEVVVNPTIDDVNPEDCPPFNHFDVFPDDDNDFVYKQFYKAKLRPAASMRLSYSLDSNADDFEILQVYSSEGFNDEDRDIVQLSSTSSSNFT
jgi:hypothetical protein